MTCGFAGRFFHFQQPRRNQLQMLLRFHAKHRAEGLKKVLVSG
jgi:hypothetical protein